MPEEKKNVKKKTVKKKAVKKGNIKVENALLNLEDFCATNKDEVFNAAFKCWFTVQEKNSKLERIKIADWEVLKKKFLNRKI